MTIPAHIQQAIQAYYAERATDDDVAALEAWFREDEAHIKVFAEHGMLEWQMLCEIEKADAAAILTMLREAEDNAEPDWSLLHTPAFETTPQKTDERTITFRQLCSLTGYVAGKGLRTKAGVISSLAAVLLLGVVLYVSFIGFGDSPDSPDLATTPSEPGRVGPDTPATPDTPDTPATSPIVATLTASHNAQWAEGDSSPGDTLRPGQRLALTAGFAEITTSRGAKVILEAPCTVELIDSPNAMRIASGMLVAHVPEQAVGFCIDTPTARIVDLGTEFGVLVEGPDMHTRVQVYRGAVRVTERNEDGEIGEFETLIADQAAKVSAGMGVVTAEFEQDLFERDLTLAGLSPESLQGDVQWMGWVLGDLRKGRQQSDSLQVFVERRGLDLQQDLPVDGDLPGLWTVATSQGGVVAAGEKVDVYLMHFDPRQAGGGDKPEKFVVHFDRPILGVIGWHETLAATDGLLGVGTTRYPDLPSVGRGGSGLDPGEGDSIWISKDRKSIEINLKTDGFIEQARILIRSEDKT